MRPDELPDLAWRWSRRRLDDSIRADRARARALRGDATRARASCTTRRAAQPARRRADDLDGDVGGRLPGLPRRGARRDASSTSTGNEYADFCLGDTGAMAGHSPEPTMRGARRRSRRASPRCCPTEDAAWVGERARAALRRAATGSSRSPPPTPTAGCSASAASVTGRPQGLVFNWCYHGSVDEAFVTLDERRRARARARATSARRSTRPRPRAWPSSTSRLGRGGARARRRGLRPDGAGAHEHRHRAAGARLPGRACASCATRTGRC